ncbi:MAG: T9SS type A sorting domain-containing protein [Bacteroidota bacterium]
MKNYYYLSSLFSVLSTLLFGQINQGTLHRGMSNYYGDVLLYPDSSFILAESIQGDSKRYAALTFKSPFAEDQWEIVTDDDFEVLVFNKLIPIDDNSFGVLGYRRDCCDCSEPISFYQVRSLLDGSLLSEVNSPIPQGMNNNAFINDEDNEFGVVLTDWGFVAPNFNGDIKTIFNFDLQGNLLNSYTLPAGGTRIGSFQGNLILEHQNKVIRYNQMGLALDSIVYDNDVSQIASSNNTLAVIQDDVLRFYDNEFEALDSMNVSGNDSGLFGFDNGFHLLTESTCYKFDESGGIELTYGFNLLDGLELITVEVKEDFFVFGGAKSLLVPNSFFPVRHLHAAWQIHNIEGESPLWNVDLGLTNITIDELEIDFDFQYTLFESIVTVTVINDGTFPASEFYLNSAFNNGICFDFYDKQFVQSTVQNQDEITVTLENIRSIGPPVLFEDSVELNICIFLTSPLGSMDTDNSDDLICINQTYYLSTDDIDLGQYVNIYPNPASSFIRIESEFDYSQIRLMNSSGQVMESNVFNKEGVLDITPLPPGFYLLLLETERGLVTKKLIIEE